MREIEVISFDVDGTIVDGKFMDSFWNEFIPKIYSETHGIGYDTAIRIVTDEYKKIGDRDIRWYIPEYWFERFNLDLNLRKVLLEYKDGLKIYPDAIETLENLKENYKIIAVTNAVRDIMEFEIKDIRKFFWKTFSCPSDLGDIRKEPRIYLEICERVGVESKKIFHVGDHPFFDYEIPLKAGIESILINRAGRSIQTKNIKKLTELVYFL